MSNATTNEPTIVCAESRWFATDDPSKPLPEYTIGLPADYEPPKQ